MARGWVRRVGRAGAVLALGLVFLVVAAVLVLARTGPGHRWVLGYALPRIEARLDGKLRIARVDGDLLRGVTLEAIELDDREGQPAIRADRIELRYHLLGLLRHRFDVARIHVGTGWVHARRLRDGRLNLATLVRPQPPSRRPFELVVQRASGVIEASWDAPPSWALPAAHARLYVDGGVRYRGGIEAAHIDRLEARVDAPAALTLEAHGALEATAAGLRLDGVEALLATDGASIDRLWPRLQLRGALRARIRIEGPERRLAVRARLEPERGSIEGEGVAELVAEAPRWHLALSARDLDPGAIRSGLPHGTLALSASGSGTGRRGRVALERLHGEVAGVAIEGRGTSDLAGHGEASLRLRLIHPARLPAAARHALGGRADAVAHVRRDALHLRFDLAAHARALRLGTARLARADARLRIVDWRGDIELGANGVMVAGRRIDTVRVVGRGDRRAISLSADARGGDAVLRLDAHARPRWRGARVDGADVSVDHLVVGAGGRRWSAAGPFQIGLGRELSLSGLTLRSGRQLARLDGRASLTDRRFSGRMRARSLDLAEIAALYLPSTKLPHTRLDVDLDGGGPFKDPSAEGRVVGASAPWPALGIEAGSGAARATYHRGRVDANALITSGPASVRARLSAAPSLGPNDPIALDVHGSGVQLARLRPLLPAALRSLEGALALEAHLGGTRRHPTLEAEARATAWRIGRLAPSSASLSLSWREAALSLHASLGLGGGAGSIEATARATLDAGAALEAPAHALAGLRESASLGASIAVRGLRLEQLPLSLAAVAPPVDGGTLEGSATFEGALRQPRIQLRLNGRALRRGEKFRAVDGTVALDGEGDRMRLGATIDLGGRRFATMSGEARLDLARVIGGQPWRDAPLRVDATVPAFELSFARAALPWLPALAGRLNARLRVAGTIAAPTGDGEVSIAGFATEGLRLTRAEGRARYDGQLVRATFRAEQAPAGVLTVDATGTVDDAGPLRLDLRASRIDLGFLPLLIPALGETHGAAEARLAVRGTRSRPIFDGQLDVAVARLRLRVDPIEYRDLRLVAALHDHALTLSRLHLTAGEGSLDAHADATLDGLRIARLDGTAQARRLSILAGSVAGWLDADLRIHGQTVDHTLRGRIDVLSGGIHLPALGGGKKLQPLGPLDGVSYDDAESRRAAKRAAAPSSAAPHLVAHLSGPFQVRSREARMDLRGDLDLDVAGRAASLTGHLEAEGGWVEVIGRRYEVEHARASFDGPIDDPELDVRISRRVREASIAVELHGRRRKPELRFSSDPPVFDQSQILGLLVSGDPSSPRISSRALDQQVAGALSSLVLGRLKSAVAPSLPVDVFNLDTGTEGPTGLGQTRVEVGKYITDKIYVSYVHQFGPPAGVTAVNSNEGRVEYRFWPGLEVDSSFGDAGVGGVDLYWTIRY